MRDRTRELRQASDSESDSEGGEGRARLRPPGDPALAQAGAVRAGLRALERRGAELEQLQELVLGTPLPPQDLQQDLQRLRDEIQDLTREIRGGLKGLEPSGAEDRSSVGARVRRTQVLVSARAARAALDEVGERHRDLQRLERGLRELGELFQLLGGTVEAQGEVLDRIERHVQDSGVRLEKGRGQLGQAQRRQQGARKRRLALAACVSVAILVLVAIVAASVAAG